MRWLRCQSVVRRLPVVISPRKLAFLILLLQSAPPQTLPREIFKYSTAMLMRDMIHELCPSVRLSRSDIISKQFNISSYFLQHNMIEQEVKVI